jgi:hypothetical protein
MRSRGEMNWSEPVLKLARRLYEQSERLNPGRNDFQPWDGIDPGARDYWCTLINDILNDETTLQDALRLNRDSSGRS